MCTYAVQVKDKLGILTHLMKKFDVIVIGGKMAYTFLAAQGVQVCTPPCAAAEFWHG